MQLILEDSAIVSSLFYNNNIKDAFPFIKEAALRAERHVAASHCGGCGSRSSGVDYNALKASIAYMSPEDHNKLKKFIGVDSIRVYFKAGTSSMDVIF